MSLKHYVEFFYPGIIMSETSVEQIKSRKEVFKIPQGSYGYRFFDREEIKKGSEILRGKEKNYSGTHYLGEVMSLEDVEERLSHKKILIRNMKCNGWTHVVKTNKGSFHPFDKGDKIVILT